MKELRLSFRHHDEIFESKEKAEQYFEFIVDSGRTESLDFGGALYAEPLVVLYKDGDSVSLILGIGTETGYITIDSNDIKNQLESLAERMGIAEKDIDALETALNKEIEDARKAEADLQAELDKTQKGAGLAEDGTYSAKKSSRYIKEAVSLKDADDKIDSALDTLDKEVVKQIVVNPNEKDSIKVKANVQGNEASLNLTTDNIVIASDIEGKDDGVKMHHGHTVSDYIKAVDDKFETKVDKKEGFSLMSDAEHGKLEGIEEGAQVNVIDEVDVYDKILTLSKDGKKLSSVLSFKYDGNKQQIQLIGARNEIIGAVDTTIFVKDGMLSDVTFDEDTNILTFKWNTDAGNKFLSIPLTKLIDIYSVTEDSQRFMLIDNYQVSLFVDVDGGLASFAKLGDETTRAKNAENALVKVIEAATAFTQEVFDVLDDRLETVELSLDVLKGDVKTEGSIKHTIMDRVLGVHTQEEDPSNISSSTLLRIVNGDKFYASNRTTDMWDVDERQALDKSLAEIRKGISDINDKQEDDFETLRLLIEAESTARTEADKDYYEKVTKDIAAEAELRTAADTALTESIETETRERALADTKLTESIAAVTAVTKGEIDRLDKKIDACDDKFDEKGAADKALEAATANTQTQIDALDLANTYDEKGAADKALEAATAHTESELAKLSQELEEKTEFVGVTAKEISIDEGPLAFLLDGVYPDNKISAGTKYDDILEQLLTSDPRKIYYWYGSIDDDKIYPDDNVLKEFTIGQEDDLHFTLPVGVNTVIVAVPNGRCVLDIYLGATKDEADSFNTYEYGKAWHAKRKLLNYKKCYNFYRFKFKTATSGENNVIVDFE